MFSSVYWDDPFMNPQQIALQLSKRWKVLFVEPSPSYVALRDPKRDRRWLRAGRGHYEVTSQLQVYLPPPAFPLKTWVPLLNVASQRWIRLFVRNAMEKAGIVKPVMFTYLPHSYQPVEKVLIG
jgi:hypothetical protein